MNASRGKYARFYVAIHSYVKASLDDLQVGFQNWLIVALEAETSRL